MNPAVTLATARRVLTQLRHDRPTLAILLALPTLLLILLRYVFDSPPRFDHVAPMLLGLFPFVVMFLVASVGTLRERRSGTLERLMTMPMGRQDFLVGYGLAFGAVALAQVAIVTVNTLTWLGLTVTGDLWLLVLVSVLSALLGMATGLAVSALARSEFQAVQFLPVVILPQTLLCGLFVARPEMARWLQILSDVMPLTYAVDAATRLTTAAAAGTDMARDLAVVGGSVLLGLLVGAATLRRRTA